MDAYSKLLLLLAGAGLGGSSSVCFAENESAKGDDGGGDDKTPKTFTQEEVSAIVSKETKAFKAKSEKAQAELAAKLAEQSAAFEKLQAELEIAGKPDAEKLKLIAEREQAKSRALIDTSTKERDEAVRVAEAARAELRQYKINTALTSAMASRKGILPDAVEKAVRLFALEASPEFDDEGNLSVEVAGVGRMTDVAKAAEAWLKLNPFFLAAPPGGAGTRAPNGRGAGVPEDLTKVYSPEQLGELAYKS